MHGTEAPTSLDTSTTYDVSKRRGSLTTSSTSPTSLHKTKSISLPKSPRLGHATDTFNPSSRHVSAASRIPSGNGQSSGLIIAPNPARSPSSSSSHGPSNSSSSVICKAPVEVRHGKRRGQIWLPDGVVDMASFGPILSMDETDATREFSKTLVWAWCDQAEMALEEMDQHLAAGRLIPLAEKAHYLKGSSASLGLVKVANTSIPAKETASYPRDHKKCRLFPLPLLRHLLLPYLPDFHPE
ncbi:hypothetical protein P389DRAFT_60092 [Cystobasidium minutum MCA 4210]|uniref:uncharacterized protein n=1 Tax=Cystobasidium minutum MCA 4210 TaxID=1397322 RepID=UPI0034CF5092|eukprot:jgi/Rhomi1/60092/CE60091_1361